MGRRKKITTSVRQRPKAGPGCTCNGVSFVATISAPGEFSFLRNWKIKIEVD